MVLKHLLRNFFRRNMKPIEEPKARLWERRLNIAYTIFCWNAFGFVLYAIYQGKNDWADYYGLKTEQEKAMPQAVRIAQSTNVDKAKIIRYKGFNKVEELDYDRKKMQQEQEIK